MINCIVVLASYKTGGRFRNIDDDHDAVFLHQLNLVYKILSNWWFLEKLLDKAYNIV